jgi:TPR repeat protein
MDKHVMQLRLEAVARVLAAAAIVSCRTPSAGRPAGRAAEPPRQTNPAAVLPWCDTASGCIDLARKFAVGDGVSERSPGTAMALLDKACALGDARACIGAAILNHHFGGEAEFPRVIGLLERACELEIGIVCRLVAQAYEEGAGVQQDLSRADELYQRACDLSDGEGCQRLASNLDRGLGVAKDVAQANLLRDKACELVEPAGCYDLGVSYENGRGVAQDWTRANALLEKACRLRLGRSCTELGLNFSRGRGVPQDWKRANDLFEQGCSLGEGTGCTDLGASYANGSGVPPDRKRANDLHEKGCELGSGLGCWNLGAAFAFGKGVTRSWARANALYEKGCDLGYGGACNELGLAFEYTRGVAKDMVRASALFDKGCVLDEPAACVEIGYLHATGNGALHDMARANSLYEKACRLGDGLGCSNLGFSYEEGAAVAQDWHRANELYAQGCELGSGKACSNLGNNYAKGAGATKDLQRSRELFEKACVLGESHSCIDLGGTYAAGTDVPKDPGRAASFFEKACALDLPEGCIALGDSYRAGTGIPRDPDRAAALYEKTCGLGQGAGCKALLAARWAANDAPGSIEALTILARRWPEALSTLRQDVILQAMRASFAPDAKEKRFRLLETIYEIGWRPLVEGNAHWAWRDLAEMLLERGRIERATQVATLITDVDVLISMRIDNRFDAIVQHDPERYDIVRAISSRLQKDREAWAKAPRSLDHLLTLLETLQMSGRAEEALRLVDEAITRADESSTPPFDDADKLNWIRNRRSDVLRQLGRWQQAVEELERASKLTESGHPNVSQQLNLAGLYCAVDRPRDALAALDSVGEMSSYGTMVLRSVNLRAAIELGDTASADRSLAWLRDHQVDAEDVFQSSLIYAGRLDDAAQVLIARLKNPDHRTEALVSVQDYLPTPRTQREREWDTRWNQVRARSDVRAAIAGVGRVERFDVVK